MRIKFLSVIVSFLLMSVAISSCLDSDETYDLSSDATIRAFGIDTISYGKYYKFTIDQLQRLIYNVDSLPVGSDTIIDRILIDTLNVTGWVTAGPTDTLFNYMEDSVDFRTPVELTVHAADGITTRKYTIQVNVHKQDPDSLIWRQMQDFPVSPVGEHRTVVINEDLFVYTSPSTAYRSSISNPAGLQWSPATISGLPSDAKHTSIIGFNGRLYVTAESGKAFYSDNGSSWTEMEEMGGMNMVTFVAGIPEDEVSHTPNTLVGVFTENGANYFCKRTDNDEAWVKAEEAIPAGFPLKDIYSTVFTNASGIKQTIVVGNTENESEITLPWFTRNGIDWVDMNAQTSDLACPIAKNPAVMYYGGMFHIMGGDFKTIYSSLVGLNWSESGEKFRYATEKIVTPGEDDKEEVSYKNLFEDKGDYSLAIDKNHYIWIVWNDGTVWRGRLNKLGFKIQ